MDILALDDAALPGWNVRRWVLCEGWPMGGGSESAVSSSFFFSFLVHRLVRRLLAAVAGVVGVVVHGSMWWCWGVFCRWRDLASFLECVSEIGKPGLHDGTRIAD